MKKAVAKIVGKDLIAQVPVRECGFMGGIKEVWLIPIIELIGTNDTTEDIEFEIIEPKQLSDSK